MPSVVFDKTVIIGPATERRFNKKFSMDNPEGRFIVMKSPGAGEFLPPMTKTPGAYDLHSSCINSYQSKKI